MKRVASSVLFGAAAACFAVNLRASPAWLFVVVACVSVFWSAKKVRTGAAQTAKRLLYFFLAGTVGLGWLLVVFPILSAQEVHTWAVRLGYPLSALGSFFLLTGRGASPWAGVIPAAFGLLVVSSFDLGAGTHGFLVVAGLAGFVYLAADVASLRGERRLGRSLLVGGFGVCCAAIASFIVLILPWTQGKVEETMIAIYTPESGGVDGQHQTRLGDLRSLKLSKKIVMRVWSERPQKLRSGVFVYFNGSQWRRDRASMRMLEPSAPATLGPRDRQFLETLPGTDFVPMPERMEGQRLIETKVVRVDGGGLATPGGTRLVHAPVDLVSVDRAGVVLPPDRSRVRLYGVLHEVNHQRTQEGPREPAELAASLQLPDNLDPRMVELAEEIAGGAPTAEVAVERVVAHLRESYQYSLDVGQIDRQDPLADFLFNKERGWCEYFAGAAAVLLRTQGIPTRYVKGFNVIGSQRKGDYYLVREWDRHAWIEAYIEGKGWLEYDPTPAAEFDSLHAGLDTGPFADAMEWMRARFAILYVELRHLEWSRWGGAVGWMLAFAVVGYGAVRLAGFRRSGKKVARPRASAPSTGLEPLIRELDRRATDLGFPRGKAEAPLEYWSSARGHVPAELRDAGLRIVKSFYRARFGGARLLPEEIQALEKDLKSIANG